MDSITVRRMRPDETDAVLTLVRDVFMQFEAPDYPPEGVETFVHGIIEDEEYRESIRTGVYPCWCGFIDDTLAGIMCMRENYHITLAFTDARFHRHGVATRIFERLLADTIAAHPEAERITLNSSPYGKPFYLHIGFVPVEGEQMRDGIIFTPMEYLINNKQHR